MTTRSTAHLVAAFPRVRVVVVGDLVLDEYLSGISDRVSPEAPVPIVQVRRERAVLGGAANTAANVAALGGHVTLAGLVGDDGAGARLRGLCGEHRIDLQALSDGRPTTRKTRVVSGQQQLARLDYEHDAPMAAPHAAALVDAVAPVIAAAQAVVVSDYAKGVVTDEVCRRVFASAKAAGIPCVVDPRPRHRGFYAGCDLITPNWKEAQALLGEPERDVTDALVADVGRRLREAYGATVVLTLGGLGIRVFPKDGAGEFSVAAVAREVFDVSGAGDTVVATLALALGAGADLREAVEVANAAAGIVVGKLGTATVSPRELLGADSAARLVAREDLRALSDALRADGKRVVTVNGSFDLLHAGHLFILEEARAQGDVLIVGLNSDASVRGYKGPRRPVVGQDDRARLLLALRCVDYVHVFDEADPIAFLDEVRPDVHANGAEYGEACIEAPTVRKHGGRIHLVRRIGGLSTSGMLERLAARDQHEESQ